MEKLVKQVLVLHIFFIWIYQNSMMYISWSYCCSYHVDLIFGLTMLIMLMSQSSFSLHSINRFIKCFYFNMEYQNCGLSKVKKI